MRSNRMVVGAAAFAVVAAAFPATAHAQKVPQRLAPAVTFTQLGGPFTIDPSGVVMSETVPAGKFLVTATASIRPAPKFVGDEASIPVQCFVHPVGNFNDAGIASDHAAPFEFASMTMNLVFESAAPWTVELFCNEGTGSALPSGSAAYTPSLTIMEVR